MKIWLIFAALIVLAIVAAALTRKAGKRRTYAYKAAPILTKGERAFADALEKCLPPGARLLAKVRMADLINTASAHDRITARDWTVLAAIELNDKSHEAQHRRHRDEFIQKACEGAGIRLHFVRAAARYDLEALRALFQEPQSPALAPPDQPAPRAAAGR